MKCEGVRQLTLSDKEIKALPSEQQSAVQESLREINSDSCDLQYTNLCRRGWEKLTRLAPKIGLPLLIKELAKTDIKDSHWQPLVQVLVEQGVSFLVYIDSPEFSLAPDVTMKALGAFAQRYPEVNMTKRIERLIKPFLKTKQCFSSQKYEYPSRPRPFSSSSYHVDTEHNELRSEYQRYQMVIPDMVILDVDIEATLGLEYFPLLEGSLKEGRCSDAEVIQIMEDLRYIPCLDSRAFPDLLEWITENRWQDNRQFARAYLRLTTYLPSESTIRAIVNLIPPQPEKRISFRISKIDEEIIQESLYNLLLGIRRHDASILDEKALVDSIASQRPWYRPELFKIFDTSLKHKEYIHRDISPRMEVSLSQDDAAP